MSTLRPWAQGTFELIVHAEMHRRDGGDFDRRMALISFDNSIEISITTYLTLNPIQRNGVEYRRQDVDQWLKNYHTKLDFYFHELQQRSLPEEMEKSEIVWYHDHRNEQYHGGSRRIPESRVLEEIRKAALWVFSVLFDVRDLEEILEKEILSREPQLEEKLQRNNTLDMLLDVDNEMLTVAGQPYSISEILYAVDPEFYSAELSILEESLDFIEELKGKYPGYVRSDIISLQFIHYNETVYLKTMTVEGSIDLESMSFITEDTDGKEDKELFHFTNTPDYNATIFLDKLDSYSIINCTGLFTEEACQIIAKKHEDLSRSK
jgi:hypothetical protein